MMRVYLVLALLLSPVFSPMAAQAAAKKPFLDIQEITSDKGFTAWLAEDHSLPIISLRLSFKGAGAALEPLDKQGLARLASNTMDEGAGEYDSQVFQKSLADNSITLSFSSGRDNFGAQLKTLTRNKDKAFELLGLALTQPRFDEAPVERMRAANLSRIRSSLSDPKWHAARLLNDEAFAGHPYAMNSGGTLTTLKNITVEDLRGFVSKNLAQDNLIISASGDITADELKAVLDDMLGQLPAKSQILEVADLTVQNGGKIILHEKEIPQTIIEILQSGIDEHHPDYQTFKVMNFILGGGGFGSRLIEEVREKRGLTYGIYSSSYSLEHLKGFSVSTSTENSNTVEVLKIVKEQIERMRNEPVSADELANAKSYIIGSMPLSLSSTASISGMAQNLQMHERPIDYLDTLADKINAITVEDIHRVAKEYLTPDNLTIILVGKPTDIKADKIVETIPNVE